MSYKNHHQYNAQSGNVFFYILMAIALFAALTYAISGDRSNNVNLFDEESAKIAAQELIEYGNTVSNAVNKLRLRGCPIEASDIQDPIIDPSKVRINFGNIQNQKKDDTPILAEVDFAPSTNESCFVFKKAGGNINTYIYENSAPSVTVGNTHKSGHGSISNRDILGVGTDGVQDLTWHIADINEKVCAAVNDLVGINNPGGLPPVETSNDPLGDEATSLVGQNTFCYYRNAANPRYFFHQVLVPF